MSGFGKIFLILGVIFIIVGVLFSYLPNITKIPFGRLPGDIVIKKDNFTFYFPLASSIILSIILTVIFYFLGKLK
ncbi:DUF2905 domain-containing protein [Hippea maritima]|uniref:DUF2905 domain-containing protein n=1 Tax=Hippea maritima (strain ATCC 700847 / DSM 10411 / MH2) TaxID=760142 RepID=F2LVF7_HIPMA|nr:DUF2905 domain-containing protein [Hippea maritima]AEA33741.1 hypothetical protein Hipma_0771 [Hippea maritima DSM 10411]